MKQFKFHFGHEDGMEVKIFSSNEQESNSLSEQVNSSQNEINNSIIEIPTVHFQHVFGELVHVPRESIRQEEIIPEEFFVPIVTSHFQEQSIDSNDININESNHNESNNNDSNKNESNKNESNKSNSEIIDSKDPNSDLIPGRYEGGRKVWESSKDLTKFIYEYLLSEQGEYTNKDKLSVLELGCGHALPSSAFIFFKTDQLERIDLQDFNEDVLRTITMKNVDLWEEALQDFEQTIKNVPIHYWGGDWSALIHEIPEKSYDIIIAAETLYNEQSFKKQWELMKHAIKPTGCIWIASKRYYYGVGGGTFSFTELVSREANVKTVMDICDGLSNVREILEITLNSNDK